MLGAIIGDIAGSRFEFNNLRSTEFKMFHKDCTFTDDTICTVAVADWLTSPANNLSKIMRWWCRKYPSSYGASFSRWIRDESIGPYYSFGNGSAMRVSPVGWLGDLDMVMTFAEKSAIITHDHPEGITGAVCIADLIFRLRTGQSKEEIKRHVELGYGYDLDDTCDHIRIINRFDETCQVTVPQAIICFLESTHFEEAIRLAVSIGGDSDTIAAITGSLAEAYYGIPPQIARAAGKYLPETMKAVIKNFYKKGHDGTGLQYVQVL